MYAVNYNVGRFDFGESSSTLIDKEKLQNAYNRVEI